MGFHVKKYHAVIKFSLAALAAAILVAQGCSSNKPSTPAADSPATADAVSDDKVPPPAASTDLAPTLDAAVASTTETPVAPVQKTGTRKHRRVPKPQPEFAKANVEEAPPVVVDNSVQAAPQAQAPSVPTVAPEAAAAAIVPPPPVEQPPQVAAISPPPMRTLASQSSDSTNFFMDLLNRRKYQIGGAVFLALAGLGLIRRRAANF